VVLGLASNGLHSNGFSLVRKVVEIEGLKLGDPAPFDTSRSLGEALLDPTRIYVKSCLAAIKASEVKALAHITGGGLIENIPRILPAGLGVDLYAKSWDLPAVFPWLAKAGDIQPREMARTFNCGIGMVIIASPDHAADIQEILREHGEEVTPIGEVVDRSDGDRVVVHDIEEAWKV
jgi:phosphoribosylformylglycinamidine cyclo-ligase